MRRALLVVAVVLLAGCTGLAPTAVSDDPSAAESPTIETDTQDAATPATTGDDGTGADNRTDVASGDPASDGVDHEQRPDPETDQLGWHDGYWHDDPVAVNTTNGLNETELDAVVARTIARVEVLRDLPFEDDVEVTVVNRTAFAGSGGDGATDTPGARFEAEQFRALFLVGDGDDAAERQDENTGQTVGGFYSLTDGEIVIISETDTPKVDVSVLAHELTHALQDQHFDLPAVLRATTQDREHARLGLVEGGAEVVRLEYEDRCGAVWACVAYEDSESEQSASESEPGESSIHLGLHINSLFPYNDGVRFVKSLRDGEDWTPVNEAYRDPPDTSREIISPSEYGTFEVESVDLPDRSSDGWTPLRPPGGPNHQVVGRAGMTAMFGYTLYDDFNPDAVIAPEQLLNFESDGELNETTPLNYDLAVTRGWTGDRLQVYERDDGKTAHVWVSRWESTEDAETFATAYEELLAHWGGTERDGVWVVGAESPFTGAYHVGVEDRTVTTTNAPTADELTEVNDETDGDTR